MDCQPKANDSAHDGVRNQVFSFEQAALTEHLLQCFKWHRGGVFLKAFHVSLHGSECHIFNAVKSPFISELKVTFPLFL